MTPTKLLIGQIIVVFAIVLLGIWFATQWAAAMLAYQPELGSPWLLLAGRPIYHPWALFGWWFHFDAYAPHVFSKAGSMAAASGFAGCGAAVAGSLWRARQLRNVTTYGSARWASDGDVRHAGLFDDAGVFLGELGHSYLRHDGPEHVMAFAPTRSGKGVGLVVPTLLGWTGSAVIHDNFLTIAVLLVAWLIVVIAFFILAVQMFVTILEFKLTSLAGFILVPFALWNRTSFLAERVLGNVVSSGIKVMVLAVIVGIGSNYFSQFTTALQGQEPDIGQTMSLVLASLALFGLGIFGPGIATGLVSGAPQLGAGAALGTALGAGGIMYLGGAGALGAGRALVGGGLGAIRAGTAMGAAASTAYTLGQETAAAPTVGAGIGGMASAAGSAARSRMSAALGLGEAAERGRDGAFSAMAGRAPSSSSEDASSSMPGWARAMKAQQSARHRGQTTMRALEQGNSGGQGANPDIKERED